ncbi:exopolyphosphatase [Staphylococcus massiliensis]|uniref:exopolyphosphatase n=1 Tax=Staphylococcus massiliensis TaxID=555791 RepID=UPI001EE018EC|nr:exopolyphosphatase [Staphylococcus massiliensis]MCG3399646.1 exopolyphosphatase [Staphylococcus massiliensis]
MERIALIDIGSNTIRLVIFEYNRMIGLNEIQNIKTPARLSQYLTDDQQMTDEGIDVLTDTLKSFKKVSDKYKVDALYPIATAAIRQSANQDVILQRVKDAIDVDIQVVPEEDEAYYGYYAVTHTTSVPDGVTVDIGGGSTEITLFKDKKLIHAHSFPFGVVTLKRKFFNGEPHNDKNSIKKMEKFLSEQFKSLDWIQDQDIPLVGIGGSARNVARIHQSNLSYPIAGVHGYTMDKKDIQKVYDMIRKSSRDDLTNLDGLSQDRVDIILPAVSVFKTLYEEIDATQFTFSRKGLREGYVMSELSKTYKDEFDSKKVRQDALFHLANEYKIESKGAEQRVRLAEMLFNQLHDLGKLKVSDNLKELFLKGAYLYYLGSFIDADSSSQHTFYIISNSSINGFTHKNRVKLALLASFKNKTLLKFYSHEIGWFDSKEIDEIQALGGIIKFVNAMNVSNINSVSQLDLQPAKKKGFNLFVHYKGEPVAEEYQANRQKKHIERILKEDMNITFTKTL